MTNYRGIRRQARYIRRSGMQPMFVINNGDQLPETIGVMLLKLAWRYRSELAPVYLAAAMLGAGWWLHAAHPRLWAVLLAVSAITALLVTLCGSRIGIKPVIERAYISATALTVGAWMAAATAVGAFSSPLPQALATGGLALSIPWWAHRRRRARVRVERKLEAWPDMAKAIGLAGSTGHDGRNRPMGMAGPTPACSRPNNQRTWWRGFLK